VYRRVEERTRCDQGGQGKKGGIGAEEEMPEEDERVGTAVHYRQGEMHQNILEKKRCSSLQGEGKDGHCREMAKKGEDDRCRRER